MISSLRTAIYTAVKGLFTDNRFYYIEAPGNTVPYGVFSELPGNQSRDSQDVFPVVYVVVNGYHTTLSSLETIEASVKGALDRQQASASFNNLTDYYVIDIDLISFVTLKNEDSPDGYYMFSHTYKFSLQKK